MAITNTGHIHILRHTDAFATFSAMPTFISHSLTKPHKASGQVVILAPFHMMPTIGWPSLDSFFLAPHSKRDHANKSQVPSGHYGSVLSNIPVNGIPYFLSAEQDDTLSRVTAKYVFFYCLCTCSSIGRALQ